MRRSGIHAFLIIAMSRIAVGQFVIRSDEGTQRYTISDRGRPVLTYNFGTVPVPKGVGGKYAVARSNYVHPLFGPNGEVLTKDYSPDHPHHRGLYWAWPEVTFKGEKHDLHALQGVFARPVKILRQEAGEDSALIEAENVWKWADKEPIVKEVATIRTSRGTDGESVIDFSFLIQALVDGVTLARRGRDHYGGFNLRFSSRQNQKITTFADPSGLPVRRSWAELSGIPPAGKAPIGIAILERTANPDYPGDWIQYPPLNWLQPTFPAASTAYALDAANPLLLTYRLIVHKGEWGRDRLASAWEEYNPQKGGRYAMLAGYRFGTSRKVLIAVEQQIKNAGTKEKQDIESELLKLLANEKATVDITKWCCRQLALIGTAASTKPLSVLLGHSKLCFAACDALEAIPGEQADKVIREALPRIDARQKVQAIAVIGQRQDILAAPQLSELAGTEERTVAAAAVDALGKIGSPEAARSLADLKVTAELVTHLKAAKVECGNRLYKRGHVEESATLWRDLFDTGGAPRVQAAALVGLGKANPADAVPLALKFLKSTDRRLQSAARAVLIEAPRDVSTKLAEAMVKLPAASQVVLLQLLAARGDKSVAPKVASLAERGGSDVQLDAVTALGILGGAEHVKLLAGMVGRKDAVGKQAAHALRQLDGEGVGKAIQSLAATATPEARPFLIDCMAYRGDPGTVEVLLKLCVPGDKIALRAACSALGKTAKSEHLPALLDLLKKLPEGDRSEAGRAVVRVCNRAEDKAPCIQMVVNTFNNSQPAVALDLLKLLPSLGGDLALSTVRKAMGSGDAKLQAAATRAMTEWPEVSAVPDLLALMQKDGPETAVLRVLALRGIVRLASSQSLESPEKVRILTEALKASTRIEDKKLVISALGKVRARAAVEELEKLLDDESVRSEAAMAIASACMPKGSSPGLSGKRVREALKRAQPFLVNESLKKQIDSVIATMLRTNLATGRPVTGSPPQQGGLSPKLAVDGKVSLRSYWSCGETPAWLQVDLQQVATFDTLHLYTYWDGKRYYQYTIETSVDGKEWKQAVDWSRTTEPANSNGVVHKVEPVEARYVRVNMLKNSANPGQHIVEIKIYESDE